ncbi:alpha/beta hydrolase [Actinosynnema sp. NPDC050801]|uniref:alpha/beta fold hydrolase n=1 Tax=unclassified Actinosynnema TaxID=2637065 RepID=UPI0033F03BC8
MSTRPLYCPRGLVDDPKAFGLRDGWFDSDFGSLRYFTSDRRTSDVATLFLHGVGARWTTWTPLLRSAQERDHLESDVVLVDLPGFGESENRLSHLDAGVVARTLRSLVQGLGYSRLRLVGHSMGGFLALDMATTIPEITSSVHIVAGAYFSVLRAVQSPMAAMFTSPSAAVLFWGQYALSLSHRSPALLRELERIGILKHMLRGLVAHPNEMPRDVFIALADDARGASFRYAASNGVDYDAAIKWGHITAPVIAVFGADDKLVPVRDMERLKDVLPSAQVSLVPDASHFLHIERPGEVLHALAL